MSDAAQPSAQKDSLATIMPVNSVTKHFGHQFGPLIAASVSARALDRLFIGLFCQLVSENLLPTPRAQQMLAMQVWVEPVLAIQ